MAKKPKKKTAGKPSPPNPDLKIGPPRAKLNLRCSGMDKKDRKRTNQMFSHLVDVLIEGGHMPAAFIPDLEAYIDARLDHLRESVVTEWSPEEYIGIAGTGSDIFRMGHFIPADEPTLVFSSHAITRSGTMRVPGVFNELALADASSGLEFIADNREAIIQKGLIALMMAILSAVFGAIARKLKGRLERKIRELWNDTGNSSLVRGLKAWIYEIIKHIKEYGIKGRDPQGKTIIDKISNMLHLLARAFDQVFKDFDWDGIPISAWDVISFIIEIGLMLTPWGWLKKGAGVLAILAPFALQLFSHEEEVASAGPGVLTPHFA